MLSRQARNLAVSVMRGATHLTLVHYGCVIVRERHGGGTNANVLRLLVAVSAATTAALKWKTSWSPGKMYFSSHFIQAGLDQAFFWSFTKKN